MGSGLAQRRIFQVKVNSYKKNEKQKSQKFTGEKIEGLIRHKYKNPPDCSGGPCIIRLYSYF
tara:strand:+ start:6132 stop:6317 length:186 start_codon:yes stop_codon:yes gene_type:complete